MKRERHTYRKDTMSGRSNCAKNHTHGSSNSISDYLGQGGKPQADLAEKLRRRFSVIRTLYCHSLLNKDLLGHTPDVWQTRWIRR